MQLELPIPNSETVKYHRRRRRERQQRLFFHRKIVEKFRRAEATNPG